MNENIIIAPHVNRGFSPLDEQLAVTRSVYSERLARDIVWLSGMLPYADCEAVLARIGRYHVAASSCWRQTQRHGSRLQTYVDHQVHLSQPEHLPATEFDQTHAQPKGISMDGGLVNTREAGWKELKVGAVFDLETDFEVHPVTGYLTKMAHGVNVRYTAVLGSKLEFEPALWHLACQHHVHTTTRQGVVADGAAWIWNIADYLFPHAYQLVDWYHATAHLAQTAHQLHPTDETARQTWYTTMRHHLYTGASALIEAALADTPAVSQAHYFATHAARLNYEQARLAGWPLGSGTVESGIKQFKQRFCGSGMRWNIANVQPMATIRGAVLTNTFDALWNVA